MVLARRLEARRLPQPRHVTDRGVYYRQHYDLGGGQPWSKSFSAASKNSLGWSKGAHGLRHSYAQSRMAGLQKSMPRDQAKLVVSQELGHFRPEDRKSTRLNSSHVKISYAVFCLKKKRKRAPTGIQRT